MRTSILTADCFAERVGGSHAGGLQLSAQLLLLLLLLFLIQQPPATCLQVWAQVCAQLADGLAGGPADLGVGVAHTLQTQHGGGLGQAPRRM